MQRLLGNIMLFVFMYCVHALYPRIMIANTLVIYLCSLTYQWHIYSD